MTQSQPPAALLRPARAADAAAVGAIYNHYAEHTTVTFDERPVPLDEMRRRMDAVEADALPWLVAELEGRVVGYAYATRWKARSAYRFAVETTVYLAAGATGRGLGRQLMDALFVRVRAAGQHTAIAGIALPNAASVRLHEALGMRQVACLKEVGWKHGRWIDVGYWQVMFGGPA